MGANFGIAGLDWQQRVNWDRMREYRIERARTMMKKHGLGAVLCMYDENVRYITGTLTPGWNRLKPGLRYAMLCGDGRPILFEQGDIGFQIERHSPWIPKENVRHSFAWIKGAAGPASTQQVNKFVKDLTPFGHPDADPKLIGRNIHVMLTPLPANKRKPKYFDPNAERVEGADSNHEANNHDGDADDDSESNSSEASA